MNATTWGVIWFLVILAILFPEGLALGTGHAEYTLSHFVRMVRFDAIGRFVFLPLWAWLTLHFALAPKWAGTHPTGWRDALAILLGIAWAVWETQR